MARGHCSSAVSKYTSRLPPPVNTVVEICEISDIPIILSLLQMINLGLSLDLAPDAVCVHH
eukprot:4000975-Prorocentrum_lima.AAC.1